MSINSENMDTTNPQSDLDFLKIQYQVLSDRRINHNTLLWDVPSLLFVAQTFLWTLALDDEKNLFIRLGISILSIITAYVSFQMFERHRLMEVVDAQQMYSIEKYFKNLNCEASDSQIMIIHHQLDKRTLIDEKCNTVSDFIAGHSYYKNHNKKSSLCQKHSAYLWKVIFIFMLVVSSLIFVYNVCDCIQMFY